ncbi:hypothetical protein GHT06_016980 [Daphnia sinensis]|uniref:Uncharacterized protein n=1 Tax=Daphnia sinensis TaxID=1820382 RepID=A0AAD5PTH1_9CRUS|nr:hypothetical protein GHT06_016980 [Daphnia sinensis]
MRAARESKANYFNGQYVLLSASRNDAVWCTSVRSFGKISEKFLGSRTGTCLTQQWYKTIDDEQWHEKTEDLHSKRPSAVTTTTTRDPDSISK